jgi:hypothetical protein
MWFSKVLASGIGLLIFAIMLMQKAIRYYMFMIFEF